MAKRKKPKAKVPDDPGLADFIQTQERLTNDYLGNPGPMPLYRPCPYTLVRDCEGNYCIVSTKHPPKPIKDPATVAQLTRFLKDLNELVSDYLDKYSGHGKMVTGPGVHIGTAEIFPK